MHLPPPRPPVALTVRSKSVVMLLFHSLLLFMGMALPRGAMGCLRFVIVVFPDIHTYFVSLVRY